MLVCHGLCTTDELVAKQVPHVMALQTAKTQMAGQNSKHRGLIAHGYA